MRRRRTAVLVLAAVGLAAVGCDNDPPPAVAAKRLDDPARPIELKPPAKPAASEPAAAQLLAEAVAAHTGGKPERLDPLKACSYTRTGVIDAPGGRVPATWKMDLHWPDRFRLRTENQTQAGGVTVTQLTTFATSPAGAWQAFALVQSGQAAHEKREKANLPADAAPTLTAQFHEDALLLLFPLADPKTVAARAPDDADLLGLHVWTPALDYALLGFDKKTKLLVRVVYTGREALTTVTKELALADHQEVGGVKLPAKVSVKANGLSKADWTKLALTAGPIDPKAFETP